MIMKFANRLHLTQMYRWIHAILNAWFDQYLDASDLNKVENRIVFGFDPVSRPLTFLTEIQFIPRVRTIRQSGQVWCFDDYAGLSPLFG